MKTKLKTTETNFQPIAEIQLVINFDKTFDSLWEAFHTNVYSCGIPLKNIAAECDLSVSDLSKRLGDNERPMTIEIFERLLEIIHDRNSDPIYYLIDKFLRSKEDQARRLVEKFKSNLPEIKALIHMIEDEK